MLPRFRINAYNVIYPKECCTLYTSIKRCHKSLLINDGLMHHQGQRGLGAVHLHVHVASNLEFPFTYTLPNM